MAEKKNQVAKATATDQNAERYRMRAQYQNEVVPALVKHFGYKNINEVPRLEKSCSTWASVIAKTTANPSTSQWKS